MRARRHLAGGLPDVDLDNETIWLTGSTTGTPLNFAGGLVQFQLGNIPGGVRGTGTLSNSDPSVIDLYASSASSPKTNFNLLSQAGSTGGAPGTGGLIMQLPLTNASDTTSTGAGMGAAVSIADWDADGQNLLLSADGLTIPLVQGSGFEGVEVSVASAIPEPSSTFLIFGLLGASFWWKRRGF